MKVGFWHTDDTYEEAAHATAAGAMDVGGFVTALHTPYILARVYYKGNPTPRWVADQILRMEAQRVGSGHAGEVYYQVGNEPNLPQEQWEGGRTAYQDFFARVRALLPPEIKLAWAGMSPGVPGWEAWYEGIEGAHAVVAHVYGQNFDTLKDVLATALTHTNLPVIIGESNFGPGPGIHVDRNQWATTWARFLDHVADIKQVLFTLYFAYTWHADMPLDTPVDARGTDIAKVTLEYAAQVEPAPAPIPLPPPAPPTPPPFRPGPVGRSWWVWYVDHVGGAQGIIDACQRTNSRNVFIKGGDGPHVWDQVTPELVNTLSDAGLNVYLWHYTYLGWIEGNVHGDTWKWNFVDEIDCVSRMMERGGPRVKGFISDNEAETEGRAAQAEAFCAAVRDIVGDRYFGHAPLPIIDYHQSLPYVQYNQLCDGVQPQFYSKNLDGDPPWTYPRIIEQWDRWSDAWRKSGLVVPPLMPSGEAYGLATPDSITEFEHWATTEEWPSYSYWSMEHAINEGFMPAIEAIALTDPAPTPPAPGDDMQIDLSPEDRSAVQAILNSTWNGAEKINAILDKYGDVGHRTGYWAEASLKGTQDLLKVILGL